jgi:catechol 2,3-dioxygenase-like lactoylglutathione lyase family enzyme
MDVILRTVRVIKIDHVQLAMPRGGEEEARGFYERLLNLHEVPKPPELAARGGCWFEDGDLKIHLGAEENFRPALKAHPALLVEELGTLITKLTAAGVDVETKEVEDQLHAYIHDPFGNRIELLGLT